MQNGRNEFINLVSRRRDKLIGVAVVAAFKIACKLSKVFD
jgi:hypothetical protein